jgi:hypothetical protein
MSNVSSTTGQTTLHAIPTLWLTFSNYKMEESSSRQ